MSDLGALVSAAWSGTFRFLKYLPERRKRRYNCAIPGHKVSPSDGDTAATVEDKLDQALSKGELPPSYSTETAEILNRRGATTRFAGW
jgi:hypothetical protein